MKQQAAENDRNKLVAMKTRMTMKDFSALSFDTGQVTDGAVRANLNPPPRLTPESVRDFNAQPNGSADAGSPQDERLATTQHCQGRDVDAPKRVKLGRWLWMPSTQPCPGSE
jgi:hypothetical protein